MQATSGGLKRGADLAAPFYAAAAAAFAVIARAPAGWVGGALDLKFSAPAWLLSLPVFAAVFFLLVKHAPQRVLTPSLLIAASAFGAGAFVNILPQLSLTFALIGAFGFVGLAPQWRRWWNAVLFPAMLIALALPFGVSAQTGFGFFMRVAVTDAASQILNLFGVTSLAAHDILIFENSLARVDAPCSGLKSLFTGTAFFLAASAVMGRRLSGKWLLAYGVFFALMITGNVARIVILVLLMEAFDAAALAELFHIPLGLVFFMIACAAGAWLLTMVERRPRGAAKEEKKGINVTVSGVVCLAAVSAALIFAPAHNDAEPPPPFIAAPATGVYEVLPLTPAETRFYNAHAQTSAKKWRFERNGLSGSMLIVRSSALTAMHAPEICFEANGIDIHSMHTRAMTGGDTVRELLLGEPNMHALYWMQSNAAVTDSFVDRLKRYAFRGENDWVMITILFDNDPGLTSKTTTEFYTGLKGYIDGLLTAERGVAND